MTAPQSSPYVGPRAFRATERGVFVGRDQQTDEVASLWLSRQFLVVFGMSGVGKTSLLQAGVVPAVSDDARAHVLPVGRISVAPGARSGRNPYLDALLASWFPTGRQTDSLSTALQRYLAGLADPSAAPRPLLGAIDQFEEFFVLGSRLGGARGLRAARDRFVDELGEALDQVPQLHLLVTIRKEFVADLMAIESVLDPMPRGQYRLSPLEPEAALAAILGPLATAGVHLGPLVAQELTRRLQIVSSAVLASETESRSDEPVDPMLLQLACRLLELEQLSLDRHRQVAMSRLPALGNGRSLLLEFCATAVATAAARSGLPADGIWTWLTTTFVTEFGTRRPVPAASLGEDEQGVVAMLVAEQLLVATECAGVPCYELVNDRMVEPVQLGGRGWPTGAGAPEQLLRQAAKALAEGDYSLAEKLAIEAVELSEPGDIRSRAEGEFLRGRVAIDRSATELARVHLETAALLYTMVEDHRSVGLVQAQLGRVLLDAGEIEAAVRTFYSAAAKVPDDHELLVDQARALRAAGDPRGARAVLGAFLNVDRDAVGVLIERATILLELGDLNAARDDLKTALALDPALADRPEFLRVSGVIAA